MTVTEMEDRRLGQLYEERMQAQWDGEPEHMHRVDIAIHEFEESHGRHSAGNPARS